MEKVVVEMANACPVIVYKRKNDALVLHVRLGSCAADHVKTVNHMCNALAQHPRDFNN